MKKLGGEVEDIAAAGKKKSRKLEAGKKKKGKRSIGGEKGEVFSHKKRGGRPTGEMTGKPRIVATGYTRSFTFHWSHRA